MIYCVEDDAGIRGLEVYTLRSSGLEAVGLESGAAFFDALRQCRPDLVLLDIMLPDLDGVSILRRLRAKPETRDIPVVMATAKGMEYDRVSALDQGADDYLAKPFSMLEMVARVKAVLRRSAPKEAPRLLQRGKLCMDPQAHTVLLNGKALELTLKEYELLRLLMEHPGRVYTRDELLSEIWGMDYNGETRTVDVHVRTLRQKLGDSANCVGTVRGVGYRLEDAQ